MVETTERIPQHRHCAGCGKAFVGEGRFCSKSCQEESGREVERLTGEAVAVLDGFSGEHEFLKELLLHLVHRTK